MLTLFAAVAMPVALAATNPLLAPWSGPHGGVPPFDKVTVELIAPALEAAMAEKLAAVERFANDPATPTFENTLAAMERSGRTLDRVRPIYDVWTSTLATPEVQSLERGMEPRESSCATECRTSPMSSRATAQHCRPHRGLPGLPRTRRCHRCPHAAPRVPERSVLALGIRDSR